MKTHIKLLLSLLLCCAALLGNGCGGDDGIKSTETGGSSGTDADSSGSDAGENGSVATATTPKIGGKWTGRYGFVQSSDPREQAVTASIRQDGSMVVISTSLVGAGATLTGTIDPDGDMVLTDPFDGETWTTYFGPATSEHVQVADFIYDSELGAASPLQVIDLFR